jgi:thiol-disulfide isomerase/thioredoxin
MRVALAAVLLLAGVVSSQTVLYPPDGAAEAIDRAVAAAKKDGRHVMLDFGADWCPDCRVLGKLFEEPAVAKVLDANFHVVRIDVGRRDKNGQLVTKYRATSDAWIPAVVVLAPDGATVASTDERVRLTRRTTAEELIARLNEWAPKRRERALATFVQNGVRVSLHLDRDWLGSLWLAGEFSPLSPDTHLYATELPPNGIQGLGRPTRLRVGAGSLRVLGPAVANRPVVPDRVEELDLTLPVYPSGPVTIRLPVALDSGRAATTRVYVSFMACTAKGCLPPVIDRAVAVTLPGRWWPSPAIADAPPAR